MTHSIALAARWTARATGLLLVSLVGLFAIGEGLPWNIMSQPAPVIVEFASLLMMLAGFLLGWWKEGIGGILAVGGFALFLATEFSVHGQPPGGAIPLFVVPGILFLVARVLDGVTRIPARTSGNHAA